MIDKEKLQETCFAKAHLMLQNGMVKDMDLFDLTELLVKIEIEKIHKQSIADSKIKYDDEIVSIEEVGEMETVDISVTGDELFYCNDVLTKNSMGITHTADAIFALISTEELQSLNQLMIKQLKNRWSDISSNRRFVVGIDKSRMKIYNAENSAQANLMPEIKSKSDDSNSSDDWGFKSKKQGKKSLFNVGELK
jgi:hypothetical protein